MNHQTLFAVVWLLAMIFWVVCLIAYMFKPKREGKFLPPDLSIVARIHQLSMWAGIVLSVMGIALVYFPIDLR